MIQKIVDSIDINNENTPEEGFKYLRILDHFIQQKCRTGTYQGEIYTAIFSELAYRIVIAKRLGNESWPAEKTIAILKGIVENCMDFYTASRTIDQGANDG